jgi:hypothetical protein
MKVPFYLLATLLLASGALAQELPPAHPEPLRQAGTATPKLKAEPVPLPAAKGGSASTTSPFRRGCARSWCPPAAPARSS